MSTGPRVVRRHATMTRTPAPTATTDPPTTDRRPPRSTSMTVLDEYLARTPRSRELFDRATASLPGGSTRTTVYTAPYPPYVASGEGLRLTDVDGNVYRDFLGNYTSLILGHAHPAVVAAVEAQVRRGSAFAAPTETEVELAEEIRRRVPSVERLRFTSSGTEATMFAIRAARAFTGRPLIGRPVNARAARIANIVASVPDEVKRNRSSDGTRRRISSASSTSVSVGAANAEPRRTWASTAATTAGWAWPRMSEV